MTDQIGTDRHHGETRSVHDNRPSHQIGCVARPKGGNARSDRALEDTSNHTINRTASDRNNQKTITSSRNPSSTAVPIRTDFRDNHGGSTIVTPPRSVPHRSEGSAIAAVKGNNTNFPRDVSKHKKRADVTPASVPIRSLTQRTWIDNGMCAFAYPTRPDPFRPPHAPHCHPLLLRSGPI